MSFIEKAKRKIRAKIVSSHRRKPNYMRLYKAYRHSLHAEVSGEESLDGLYFAARPNPGAGIGHQMANWIAGYWFSRQFGLGFAHIPFTGGTWEDFLGFDRGEKTIPALKKEGYRVVRIPLFDENDPDEVNRIKRIFASYAGKRIVFLAEQDQFYHDQYGVMDVLQEKFYSAPARVGQKLLFAPTNCNIAVHVRRGDIVQAAGEDNPNLTMRYQNNEYFVAALEKALSLAPADKEAHIWVFTQSAPSEFPELTAYPNVHFCNELGAQDSFLHMVYADILVTSKSSFSYKPALLSKGIRVCPRNFWHGYPEDDSWILMQDENKNSNE